MSILNENPSPANLSRIQGVQMLIIGRLVVSFLLLAAAWIWYSGRLNFDVERSPTELFLGFFVCVGLSIVYFFLLRWSNKLIWQIRLQLTIDALLITLLVWRTGDLTSPYITLYLVLICIASLYLRPMATIATAFISAIFFVLMALWAAVFAPSLEITQAPSKLVQLVAFHVVAILVVGLLAARLAERRSSGDQLAEATKSLANLRVLHERIIESIRSGLITTDDNGIIYTFNAAATEITGYQPKDVVGHNVSFLIENIESSIAAAAELSPDLDFSPRFETDLITPDGFAVCIGYSVATLFSEANIASGWIITFQDLTEIRSMEQSSRRKERLAAVGRVGAGLAHEIRNPLGAMRGAIQVLQSSSSPNSVQSDLMDIILRESDRLNNIITNFLSYATPKVGNYSEIDVNEAIKDTVTLLRHSPDLRPEHTIEEGLPQKSLYISADATQLKQVFWNLSRNALQAMPGGGTLSIKLDLLPANRVSIIFADTGKGMSQKQVEQLFEPFATSTTGGTGLGLSIVYQIIKDHDGSINVRSTEGKGTIITIELPLEQRNLAPTPANAEIDESVVPNSFSELLNVKNGQK